jgi:hypothetical protein
LEAKCPSCENATKSDNTVEPPVKASDLVEQVNNLTIENAPVTPLQEKKKKVTIGSYSAIIKV